MSVFMQPLYTQTLGAGVTTVTFNNIPQGFTDLKVVVSARGIGVAANDALLMTANGGIFQTTSRLYSDTTNAYATQQYANNLGLIYANIPAGSTTANAFSNHEIYITNYTAGTYKAYNADTTCQVSSGGGSYVMMWGGLILTTAPITTLSFICSNPSAFAQYTTITVYGISNVYDTAAPTAPTLGTITDQAGFFSVGFTPAVNDQADSYYAYSPASPSSPIYGASSPISIPVEAQYNYNASIWVAAVNSLGVTQSATTSTGNVTSNNFTSLATVTSSGTTSQILFGNVPLNYTYLQLRIYARSARASANDLIYMRFNGDSGSNYYWHSMYGDGSGAFAGGGSDNVIYCGYIPAASSTADTFGYSIVNIYDYQSTGKAKSANCLNGFDANGSGLISTFSAVWNNVGQPVTTLFLANYFTGANFAAGTVFALYGMA
jgi:hypothetical protein